ncbi:hypothetical protein [Actinocorallia longicatena]|uniref:Uncharacterized protein n=1 Tax=Actinocorallia longicatena TaxID=111803 RepID=A0ABP6QCZ0_9ACTN
MVDLGLAIAEPVRGLARDSVVEVARAGLEWALELPVVKGQVEQAAQYAAQRVATSLAERAVADIVAAAEANVVTSTALGVTTTVWDVAGQAAGHPLSRAARRFAMRNPLARATTSTWVGLTERAVRTSLAQAATNVALDSVVDVVADVVMDVVLEVGPELAVEIGERAARQAARDMAAASAARLSRFGLAASPPVRRAGAMTSGIAGLVQRSGLPDAAGRGVLTLAARAAKTDLGTALGAMVEDTARAVLRERMKDTARDSVRLAWGRAVDGLLGGRPVEPLPSDARTVAARRIGEVIAENRYSDAAKGVAVKVTFRMAPSAVPKIAVSAVRSTGTRALRFL